MTDSYIIKFSSEEIKSPNDYHKFFVLFASFGKVLKVYLNYTFKCGNAFFVSNEDAQNAYKTLKQENPFNMYLKEPTYVLYRSDSRKSEVIEFEFENMYNCFGEKFPVALSPEGEVFFPLKNLEVAGFKFYKEPISDYFDKADELWLEQFHHFLHQQSLVFIHMTKTLPSKKTVDQKVTEVINVAVGANDVSSSPHSKESNSSSHSKSNSIARQDLELNQMHSVKVLTKSGKKRVYWVNLVSNLELLKDIETKLQLCSEANPITSLYVNLLCGCLISDKWMRVCVTNLDPLECFCIDSGYTQRNITIDNLYPLPTTLCDVPGQAIRIKIDDSCNNREKIEIDAVLNICPTRKYHDETLLVKDTNVPPNIVVKINNTPGNNTKSVTSAPSPSFVPNKNYDKDNKNYAKDNQRPTHSRFNSNSDNTNSRSYSKSNNQNGYSRENLDLPKERLNSSEKEGKDIKNENLVKSTSENVEDKPFLKHMRKPSFIKEKIKEVAASKLGKDLNAGRKCIGELLKGTEGIVTCVELTPQKAIFFVIPHSEMETYTQITTIPSDLPAKTRITIGDYCAIIHDDEMVRCIVTKVNSNNEYKVALIDYGVIKTTSEIFELPNEYKLMPEFIVSSKIEDIPSGLETDKEYKYSSTENFEFSLSNKMIKCQLWDFCETNNEPTKNEVKTQSQKVIKNMLEAQENLKIGDMVMLISENQGTFGFRTKDLYGEMNKLLGRLNNYNYVKLDHEAQVDEYVIHKTESEYRRCLILSKTSNNIEVKYVDYNTLGSASMDDIFYLSEFSEVPAMLKLVKLKGYENKPLSKKVQKFIETLLKKKFNISFVSKNMLVNSVDITWDGKNLSEVIEELDRPAFKTFKDVKKHELIAGETYVLLLSEVDIEYTVFTQTDERVIQASLELTEKLTSSDNLEKPLNLHVGEICIGLFEDDWYRAEVIEILDDDRYLIYFFDYGNFFTLSLSDIRVLPREFLEYPVLSVKCRVKDNDNPAVTAALIPSEAITIKVNLVVKDNIYDVEVVL